MALPRHLSKVASVLNVDEQKDDDGHRLMLQMCKPRSVGEDGTIHWWDEEDPEKLAKLIEYCKQDVRAERAVAKKIRRLGEMERQVYLVDQKINDRGVKVDVPLVKAAQEIVEEETEVVNSRLHELTNGEVSKVTQVQRLTEWINGHPAAEIENLRKATIRDALEEYEDVWPEDVLQALRFRQQAAKSSNRKLDAMLRCRCEDDYARGLHLYHGASTGRWSGKLIQTQNMPRPTVDDVEQYIPAVLNGTLADVHEEPLEVISSLLRSMLVASDGHRLLSGDYSQIEARITGWVAGEPFADMAYEKMAARIFDVPLEQVTGKQRQVGKVAELGCGFGMGSDRYKDTVKEWTGVEITESLAERAVQTYRESKPGIRQFWYDIEDAALAAVKQPGSVQAVGPNGCIRYTYRGQFLFCILPSGRPLAYALPQVQVVTTPWGEPKEEVTFCGIDGYSRKWERQSTYGGHLTENVVQAMARDVMAEAMLRLEEAGYPVVLSVHDELVADVPEGQGSLEEYLAIMQQDVEWAPGLEIEVEGWEGRRYRK